MRISIVVTVLASSITNSAFAGPTAEIAKICESYAFLTYPKEVRTAGASGTVAKRQAYFRDCLAKNGEVPKPDQAKP